MVFAFNNGTEIKAWAFPGVDHPTSQWHFHIPAPPPGRDALANLSWYFRHTMEALIAQITTTGTKIEKRPQLGLDLLLLEGRADGPIHVQIPDTKYDLYILPHASLDEYRNHNKMNLAGIYFILDDLDSDEQNLYIGKAAVRKNNDGTIKYILLTVKTYVTHSAKMHLTQLSFSGGFLTGTCFRLVKGEE
ncbi:hypothetical protein ACTUM0_03015 [Schaalia turicensis]|uniref:Uncharacterized protein n=2 Tax=Schaalia turicensis TaxID=131111 RepID=A0A2I1I688_9ACTO|nr:hypothetical protein CYJ25_03600 [Schaalia turicensis]